MLNYPQSRAACAMSLWLAIVIPAVVATLLWSMLARMPASAQESSARMVRIGKPAAAVEHSLRTDGSAPMTFALAIAKVAANEARMESLADAALIYQVTLAHGKNSAERLAWLKRNSARVLGNKPCLRGNCNWTRNLEDNDALPDGLNVSAAWWAKTRALEWRALRAYARRLVSGEEHELPCREQPETWGSRALDSDNVKALGMHWLGCHGTENDGAAY